MRVLVLGGAGYIGSHMCKMLHQNHHEVVVFDNLSTGHAAAVKWGRLIQADIIDKTALERVLSEQGPFDLIMHFCAKSLVGESVQNPALYYLNNVTGTLNLLDAMVKTGHNKLVFSSTAAVFGVPEMEKIDEKQARQPINPYGQSKKMVEDILQDYHRAYGLNSVCLRYFNACGADPDGEIGERHEPETHLIPNILKSVRDGKSAGLKVFGNNYPTTDGTCIRDYIHINDLAAAHLAAGRYIEQNDGAYCFNLGNGNGFSVLDVIHASEQVVGQQITYEVVDARAGDPARLVADASLAIRELGWDTQYKELKHILETAWNWHKNEKF